VLLCITFREIIILGLLGEDFIYNMEINNRVAIGMSGGVDSSVAAYLLKKEGFDVIGLTMKVWVDHEAKAFDSDKSCCSLRATQDAKKVAEMLGVPHYTVDFSEVFYDKIVNYFINEYLKGRTPNPCVLCNRQIKFGELLEKAFELGAYYIATGHYVRKDYDEKTKRYLLKKGIDSSKDQSYVLYRLTQKQLEHALFPLGNYKKEEIRALAEELKLPVAKKPESQEICFIPDNDYSGFIKRQVKDEIKPGEFRDVHGKFLGYHKGIIHYTIGQRRGLGLSSDRPLYVVDIDVKNNVVVVGHQEDVWGEELISSNNNFISIEKLKREMKVTAKIRYTAKEEEAIIKPYEEDKVLVKFLKPQRAITPGQSVVFYDKDVVVGGGIIEKKVR